MGFTTVDTATPKTNNGYAYRSPYTYTPSQSAGTIYVVLFAIILFTHIILGIKYKYWLIFVTVVPGTCLQVIGWSGRLWSAYDVLRVTPFLMQISTLIIAPASYSAFIYAILGTCISQLGECYSALHSRAYLGIFVIADIISLVIQAVGGGKAAVAAQNGTSTEKSTKIMLAGILFQLGTMSIFTILAIDFIARVIFRRPYAHRKKNNNRQSSPGQSGDSSSKSLEEGNEPKAKVANVEGGSKSSSSEKISSTPTYLNNRHDNSILSTGKDKDISQDKEESTTTLKALRSTYFLLIGIGFSSIMIFIRGIYRSLELEQGWSGHLITHERYFLFFDGLVMVLCVSAFAVGHPGWLLPRRVK